MLRQLGSSRRTSANFKILHPELDLLLGAMQHARGSHDVPATFGNE